MKITREPLVRSESMSDYASLKRKFLPTRNANKATEMDTTDPRRESCLDVPTHGVDFYLDDNVGE